jgi:hypothetical protein
MRRAHEEIAAEVDACLKRYRASAEESLRPLVVRYCPFLHSEAGGAEYRKLIELSAKMQMVGHACTEIGGFEFDKRRQHLSCLFAVCCFLGDSFLDDYGEDASREYVRRFELLLTRGWFDIRTDRERAFYVTLARLFAVRDVFHPMLRQALWSLFLVQKLDVELTLNATPLCNLSREKKLSLLRICERDRSGHAITVLALLLVPSFALERHHLLYAVGSLISSIDDFGDAYFDRASGKPTYMNQVKQPAKVLAGIFGNTLNLLNTNLPHSHGRELLKAFLSLYYATRLRKHYAEKLKRSSARPVYE